MMKRMISLTEAKFHAVGHMNQLLDNKILSDCYGETEQFWEKFFTLTDEVLLEKLGDDQYQSW